MDALGVPLVLKVRQENFLSTAGVHFWDELLANGHTQKQHDHPGD